MIDHGTEVVRISGQEVERSTLKSIQTASAESGVSFHYLLAKAAQESGFDSNAKSKTSSASGLFQFTRGTWLDMMRRHGDALGFNNLASQIRESVSGRLSVGNENTEVQILGMRSDPEISSKFAALFAGENSKTMEAALGREAAPGELYLAHFLGAWGATALMTAAEQDPTKPASELLPAAAHANKSVFFSSDGKSRSASGVISWLKEKFSSRLHETADIASLFQPKHDIGRDLPSPNLNEQESMPLRAYPSEPFDIRQATLSRDASKMGISMYLLQMLSEMLAAQPMQMVDDPFAMTPSGFSGSDWGSALSKVFNAESYQTVASAERAYQEAEKSKGISLPRTYA